MLQDGRISDLYSSKLKNVVSCAVLEMKERRVAEALECSVANSTSYSKRQTCIRVLMQYNMTYILRNLFGSRWAGVPNTHRSAAFGGRCLNYLGRECLKASVYTGFYPVFRSLHVFLSSFHSFCPVYILCPTATPPHCPFRVWLQDKQEKRIWQWGSTSRTSKKNNYSYHTEIKDAPAREPNGGFSPSTCHSSLSGELSPWNSFIILSSGAFICSFTCVFSAQGSTCTSFSSCLWVSE